MRFMKVPFSVQPIFTYDEEVFLEESYRLNIPKNHLGKPIPKYLHIYFDDLSGYNESRLYSKYNPVITSSDETNYISQYIEISIKDRRVYVVEDFIRLRIRESNENSDISFACRSDFIGSLNQTPEFSFLFSDDYQGIDNPIYIELARKLWIMSGYNEDVSNFEAAENLDRFIREVFSNFRWS